MPKRSAKEQLAGYLVAGTSVATTTGIIQLTHADSSLVIVELLYLLAVQAVAFSFGSRAAILASFLAFLTSDWFFVEPRYQFTIRDPFEFVALCVFLVTAITIGQLTALFHNRADEAQRRANAASALAESSWTVASELDTRTALNSVLKHLAKIASFKQAAILLRESKSNDFSTIASLGNTKQEVDQSRISRAAIEHLLAHGTAIGLDGSPHWDKALGLPAIYLPVIMDGICTAILFVELIESTKLDEADRQVVESIGHDIAVVLQRDKLVQEQASAQALVETDRLKTALLQMVSHDFRSPLSSIKVSVSSLLDDEQGPPLEKETRMELLETIESEADRLNKMVGNILDLSRLETGHWSPRRESTVVADLIGATLDSFNAEQNKRIKVILDKSATEISVDPVQIEQVLKNLVENALKYSSHETIVELETTRDKDNFIIRVLDRGLGLPQGEEDRIFDPFYRAPKYRETSTPGVGMRLAIARGLIEAHGATLSARNREGGGAIFEILFPGILAKASCSSI